MLPCFQSYHITGNSHNLKINKIHVEYLISKTPNSKYKYQWCRKQIEIGDLDIMKFLIRGGGVTIPLHFVTSMQCHLIYLFSFKFFTYSSKKVGDSFLIFEFFYM